MSTHEPAPNPQPSLSQNMLESAELVNYLNNPGGFNITDVPVPGAVYELNRQRNPEQGRATITLAWANQGELVASDDREVTSMVLDVPKDSPEVSSEAVQTYRFTYFLHATQRHAHIITIDQDQQTANIVKDPSVRTPPHWEPLSDEDTEQMLNIFHDALQEGKRLNDEKVQEIREHNELWAYIKVRWPDGLPDDTSSS
jgi:hypothetical protein